jgi:hypothetical protein
MRITERLLTMDGLEDLPVRLAVFVLEVRHLVASTTYTPYLVILRFRTVDLLLYGIRFSYSLHLATSPLEFGVVVKIWPATRYVVKIFRRTCLQNNELVPDKRPLFWLH